MYFDKDSQERKSAQTALMNILEVMVRILSPILSFTCDEVWEKYPEAIRNNSDRPSSVQLAGWPKLEDFVPAVSEDKLNESLEDYSRLLDVRDAFTRALEEEKVKGKFGKSQEVGAKMLLPNSYKDVVEKLGAKTLEELFIASESEIEYTDSEDIKVEIFEAHGEKCPRCWNYRQLNENGVCERCAKVLDKLNFNFEE